MKPINRLRIIDKNRFKSGDIPSRLNKYWNKNIGAVPTKPILICANKYKINEEIFSLVARI